MNDLKDTIKFSLQQYLEHQKSLGLKYIERELPEDLPTKPKSESETVFSMEIGLQERHERLVTSGIPSNIANELTVATVAEMQLPDDLGRLKDLVKTCTRCRLADERSTVVFGEGNRTASLLFIGEAPGEQEDRQGLPFVGPAGQMLTKIIGAMGFIRAEVFITNIVKCRPPMNRDPLPAEASACRPYLLKQIDIISPKIIVALGRIAAQNLLNSTLGIGELRGKFHDLHGIRVMATFHPAALLYDMQLKRAVWEDMKQVMTALGKIKL